MRIRHTSLRYSRIVFTVISLLLFLLTATSLGACKKQATPGSATSQGSTSSDPSPDAAKEGRPPTLHNNDLNWLVKNSPFIFVGRLSKAEGAKDERGLIITRNQFEIEKVIAGSSQQTITLTTLGGTVGNETMDVSHMPVFNEGQRYIVFTDLKRTTYNPITENQGGVFLLGPDSTVYTYNGIGVSGVESGILQMSDVTLEVRVPKGTETRKSSPEPKEPQTEGANSNAKRTEVSTKKPISLDEFTQTLQRIAAQQQ